MPKANTKPERTTERILKSINVPYSKQHGLFGYFFDFYLPDQNILLEINGDYFHSNPLKYDRSKWNRMQVRNHKRDVRKLNVAIAKGYNVVYIWENDLDHYPSKVKAQLSEVIKTLPQVYTVMEDTFPEYASFYKIRERTLQEKRHKEADDEEMIALLAAATESS